MAATYSTAPSSVAQSKAKTDIKFTAELDEILKRITEIKNIAGVVVVNSEGITVKSTLENSLSVQVLIFGLFSSGYVLIKGGTFINFFIFYFLNLFFTFFPSAMYKKIKLLVILRGGYAYSRGYVYCFCQMFQGLHLFKGVRLFRSL